MFIEAWFGNEFERLSYEDFQIVYTEYIDISGMYKSKELELHAYIVYLKNRTLVLKTIVEVQRMCLETFNKPYEGADELFESFGHKLIWDGNVDKYKIQLDKISSRVRTMSTELKHKEFEYNQLKDARKNNEQPIVQTRHDFIRMLNTFNKNGFNIDRDKTTVEELALMIKQIKDESAELIRNGLQHT